MPSATEQRQVFTVASLNAEVRQVLEQGFGMVWLMGEISNFAAPGSGHWYLTLKDERAQIRAAMFRNANQRVRIRPQNGIQVLVRAKITVYEPRGDYQLIIEHMEDAGAGLLQQQYEQLKQKLQAEGLFDPAVKKPLPSEIRRVGVLTSPTGAAIRDVLAVLKRRDPSIEVVIYPSAVQGQAATQELLRMLQRACDRNEVDVLIITRGGGSLEDLWCFNDEQLAYALHSCPLPTISAVGHEVDFTIADFVCDVRAPTPSAAAELVSTDQRERLRHAQQFEQRLQQAWLRFRTHQQQAHLHLHRRLLQQDPQRRLHMDSQRADDLQERSIRAMQRLLQGQRQNQTTLVQRLQRVHPQRQLEPLKQHQHNLEQRLARAITTRMKERRQQFAGLSQALQMVSPLQTIARGYAVAQKEDGQVIRSPADVETGESFQVRVAQGQFSAVKTEPTK